MKYLKYWRKTSLKQKGIGDFLLNHIKQNKPKNFLEIGVFHGVTSRNVCDLLQQLHNKDFSFTGIDLFTAARKSNDALSWVETNFSSEEKKA